MKVFKYTLGAIATVSAGILLATLYWYAFTGQLIVHDPTNTLFGLAAVGLMFGAAALMIGAVDHEQT